MLRKLWILLIIKKNCNFLFKTFILLELSHSKLFNKNSINVLFIFHIKKFSSISSLSLFSYFIQGKARKSRDDERKIQLKKLFHFLAKLKEWWKIYLKNYYSKIISCDSCISDCSNNYGVMLSHYILK